MLVGSYVCQNANQCCGNGTACPGSCDPGSGFACVTDEVGNQFCEQVCTDSSTCGAGRCRTWSFAHSGCPGPLACGPAATTP